MSEPGRTADQRRKLALLREWASSDPAMFDLVSRLVREAKAGWSS